MYISHAKAIDAAPCSLVIAATSTPPAASPETATNTVCCSSSPVPLKLIDNDDVEEDVKKLLPTAAVPDNATVTVKMLADGKRENAAALSMDTVIGITSPGKTDERDEDDYDDARVTRTKDGKRTGTKSGALGTR